MGAAARVVSMDGSCPLARRRCRLAACVDPSVLTPNPGWTRPQRVGPGVSRRGAGSGVVARSSSRRRESPPPPSGRRALVVSRWDDQASAVSSRRLRVRVASSGMPGPIVVASVALAM